MSWIQDYKTDLLLEGYNVDEVSDISVGGAETITDWLAHSGRSDYGRVPVPGLVEFVVKQLGLKEGEVDDLTSLLVKCSVATLAGGALTLGGIYSMWKLWSYFRNGCSTPDPMARAFSLFNEARVGSNFGAFRSQTGRYIPNFYNNVRDSVAPRFSSFFRRGDVEEDWTSVEMSDRSGCDSPRPRHGKDETQEFEDCRPVIPIVLPQEVVVPPLLVRREEGGRSIIAPTLPVRAVNAGAALPTDGAKGKSPEVAALSLADQIRNQHSKMLL